MLSTHPSSFPSSETLEQRRRGMEAVASSGSKQSKIRSKKKRRREKSSSPPSLTSLSLRPSSPTLSLKYEKSVYVRVLNINDELEWYSFGFNGSDEDEKRKRGLRCFGDRIPVLTPFYAKGISSYSSCAAVDSNIYCVGGKSDPDVVPVHLLQSVRRLNTSRPKRSWKKARSMLDARCSPQAVSLNGKIYVMGCTEKWDLNPWGEVFNPQSKTWVPLTSPSGMPTASGLFVAALHDHGGKVVVGSTEDNFLCTYDEVNARWTQFPVKMNYSLFRGYPLKPVAVGTTLFWFYARQLHAYDYLSQRYSSGFIDGLEKIIPLEKLDARIRNTYYIPVLLHIADTQLMLLLFENLYTEHVTLLHCIKFCVSKYTLKGLQLPLSAATRSCQTFIVQKPHMILDAVLIPGQPYDGGKSSSVSTMSPSSSRLLAVKHNNHVYVRVVNMDAQLEWYSFVFNASDEDGLRGFGDYLPILTPLKSMKKISVFSGCAAVNSTIYCVGGTTTPFSSSLSDEVHCLDTSLPKPSWVKGPLMLNGRSDFCTVTLNRKIYVIGGTKGCGIYDVGGVSEPWAEVFDPISNEWVALSSPSPKPSDSGLFSAALQNLDKIVVGSNDDNFLCLYDVMNRSWDHLSCRMRCGPHHVPPVAVGTTLFWFQDSELHAYNLLGKWGCTGRIDGLQNMVFHKTLATPILLHIDGDHLMQFYLISFDNSEEDVTLLHCVRFCVFVHCDKGSLDARAESHQSYLIRTPALISDALLMDTGDSSSEV